MPQVHNHRAGMVAQSSREVLGHCLSITLPNADVCLIYVSVTVSWHPEHFQAPLKIALVLGVVCIQVTIMSNKSVCVTFSRGLLFSPLQLNVVYLVLDF